jgi:hypothetical protein
MSDQNDDKWEMPKPVFRTSTGGLPKSFEVTISQQFTHEELRAAAEAETEEDDILSLGELPTEPANRVQDPTDDVLLEDLPTEPANRAGHISSEEPVDDHPESADPEEAAEAEEEAIVETQPKRSTFWSFTKIFLLMVLIVAAVVVGIFYYLSRRPPG